MPRAKEPPAAPGEKVKVRVLTDCHLGKPNDVVEVDSADLEGLADVADADPAAVAYAESLNKE